MSEYGKVEIIRNKHRLAAELTRNVPGIDEYAIKCTGISELLEIKFQLPVAEIAGFWHASRDPGAKMRLDWNIDFVCGGQFNFPGLAMLDRNCRCLWGITLTNIHDDTHFSAKLDQEKECYHIAITIAISEKTEDFTLRIDQRRLPQDAMLNDWRKSLDLPIYEFPEAAWNGVFCSWYAKHGAVDAAWLEPTAECAASLGFKTLIVDDGWCYDEYCRVNPETLANWYRTIGDYRVSKVKFPNFAEHVKRVQDMGLKYLLWVAPHLIGCDSEFYANNSDAVIEPLTEGYRRFDVKNTAAGNQLAEKLVLLMQEGNLDGLKIDFIDIVKPDPASPNSRATTAFAKKLSDAVRSVKSDALIEFRQGYANCAMLPYATQFRIGDAPFDALRNFARIAEIRMAMGSNVPIHADPAFWSKNDPAECVARHMIGMLGAVPMVSMDLLTLSPTEKSIIRRWMDFYYQHQTLLNHGKWRVEMKHHNIAALTVEDDKKKIILLNDSNYISEIADSPGKETYLANLSERSAMWKADRMEDVLGSSTASSSVPVGGCAIRQDKC